MKSKYQPYETSVLDELVKEPWEISDQPYKLFASMAVSSIYDICAPDKDDEEEFLIDDMWGCSIPTKIIDRLIEDAAEDFNDAAKNHKPIKIWNKSYSIRKTNAYDHNRLKLLFNFPEKDGEYLIVKEGVLNLAGESSEGLKKYEESKDDAKANRIYLRQIIKLAEDDENDGWDKLTDMEIVMYCWALFYHKNQVDNLIMFLDKYKRHIYVSVLEIESCYIDRAVLRGLPMGMYTFSYKKVNDWNIRNHQESEAIKIPPSEAEDYWYDIALKNTFRPKL